MSLNKQAVMDPVAQAILSAAVLGGGLGVGARGLVGLRNALAERTPAVAPTSSVPVPLPVLNVRAKRKRPKPLPLAKVAAALAQRAGQTKQAKFPGLGKPSNPQLGQYAIPGQLMAGAGGLVAGWSLLDWLLDKNRKSRLQEELSEAEQNYFDTVRQQYRKVLAPQRPKLAAEDNTANTTETSEPDPLDAAFDRYEAKQAFEILPGVDIPLNAVSQKAEDAAHVASGGYLSLLALLGAGSAAGAYHWANQHSKQRQLNAAIKARAKQRLMPQPVYAVPVTEEEEIAAPA